MIPQDNQKDILRIFLKNGLRIRKLKTSCRRNLAFLVK